MINIESLIDEHLPALLRRPPLIRKSLQAMLRIIFHEKELQNFQARFPHLEGHDFVEQLLDYFDFGYTLQGNERERIPVQGRVIIIANHPIGTLDAAVLVKLAGEIRRDVKAVSNQLLAAIKPLSPLLLPVDNLGSQTSREQLRAVYTHLEKDGAVIIFPAGEVSRMGPSGIRDGCWSNGFLRIAKSTKSPILPIYVNGRNSIFFYTLSWVARPLSSLWLIREMFKQASRSVNISIGNPITYENYQRVHLPLKSQVKLFQRHVYRIGKHKEPVFATLRAIAHPEERQLLRQEIRRCELLGETRDRKSIYLYEFNPDSSIMREIGRLRELSFRAAGEGTGKRRDVDTFDRHCQQIILWDEAELEIVGAYRLRDTRQLVMHDDNSDKPVYTTTLFDLESEMQPVLAKGLELGRSFVQPRYWGRRSLDYLWFGIGAYLHSHPGYRYLFGPVSISDSYPVSAKDMLVYFYAHYFSGKIPLVRAKLPYRLEPDADQKLKETFCGSDYKRDFVTLKSRLAYLGHSVPTLFKQYGELCDPGGVQFSSFNIDPGFANCIDAFVVVDLQRLKKSKRIRYIKSGDLK